ncbi:MAG: hypothetical protein LBM78_04035, partial [Clostridiales bacterium]|nr:hypothetical protein [Clostridiales bacterium]
MRYVNCEYGLPFRPPRAAQFSAVTTKGARLSAESFPKKVTVGAGLDFAVPNGVLLCGSRGSLWGIEADGCLDRKAFREGRQYLDDPRARLKCAEDFSCAAFAAADIAFTAVRIGENGILIRIPLPKKRRARVRLYIPFGWPGTLDVEGVRVRGRAPYVGIIPGTVTPTPSGIAEIKGRYRVEQDDLPGRELFIFESDTAPASVEKRGAEVHFVFAAKAREAVVTLFAAVGGAGVLSERPPTAEDAAPLFEAAARVLAGRQMSGKGLGQAASSLYWGVLSSRIYNPYLMSVVCTPSRTGMDRFFNADGTADNAMAVLMSLIADAPRLYPGDYGMLVPAAWEAYAHASDKSTI